jgi:hypothetical protein
VPRILWSGRNSGRLFYFYRKNGRLLI